MSVKRPREPERRYSNQQLLALCALAFGVVALYAHAQSPELRGPSKASADMAHGGTSGQLAVAPDSRTTQLREGQAASTLKRIATFRHVPVGIAVSEDDRVFLAFSRAIDETEPFSVAELKEGTLQLFPPGYAQEVGPPANSRLLSVQALTVDAKNRLWILDTAKLGTNPIKPGSAKLVAWDLGTNKRAKVIGFTPEVAGATAFLNDVRIDLSRGREGVAYITDASAQGPNAIVVVDLASGKAVRRLNDHASTRPQPGLKLAVEDQPLIQKQGVGAGKPFSIGADGIALSGAGRFLYYSPLTSHRLYRISTDVLANFALPETEVARAVEDLGDKGFAADGMLEDAAGNIYSTDFEHSAVRRRTPAGVWELVVLAPELRWPDTLALKSDGSLIMTVTQIDRSKLFQGEDARRKPFALYQVKTDSKPSFVGR